MTTPILALVVAVAENGVIGRDGGLPWRISTDLKTFRTVTMGKPLIMGRKTFESIGKPLDGRDNIVITRDPAFAAKGVLVARSIGEAVALGRTCADARRAEEIMIIGGADIFAAFLPLAGRIYWTEVGGRPAGDVVFPSFDRDAWTVASETPLPRGLKDEYACTLKVLQRSAPPRESPLGGAGPAPI